jgi:hypothetical protein
MMPERARGSTPTRPTAARLPTSRTATIRVSAKERRLDLLDAPPWPPAAPPSACTRNRILVDNPIALQGFGKMA